MLSWLILTACSLDAHLGLLIYVRLCLLSVVALAQTADRDVISQFASSLMYAQGIRKQVQMSDVPTSAILAVDLILSRV